MTFDGSCFSSGSFEIAFDRCEHSTALAVTCRSCGDRDETASICRHCAADLDRRSYTMNYRALFYGCDFRDRKSES